MGCLRRSLSFVVPLLVDGCEGVGECVHVIGYCSVVVVCVRFANEPDAIAVGKVVFYRTSLQIGFEQSRKI